MKPRLTRLAALSAIGAVAGTLAELVHLRTGVWARTDESALPWWIAVVYFVGLFGFGLALGRWGKPLEVSRRRVAVEAAAFLLLLLLPSAMPAQELMLTGIALGWVGVRLVAFREPGDLAFAAGAALANLALELPMVLFVGLYTYPSAHFLPVPLWLFPFWAALGLGLRRFFAFAAPGGSPAPG